MDTCEEPEVTYTIKGGIYGTPFVLTLNGPKGKVELKQGIGRETHRMFVSQPRGPIRNLVVKEAYERLTVDEQEGVSGMGEEEES